MHQKYFLFSILLLTLLGGTSDVFAANTAPTFDPILDVTITEGTTFTSSGSFTDPDTADPWSVTADYGDGSLVESLTLSGTTFTLSHFYPQDSVFVNGRDSLGDPIPFTVTVTVDDGTTSTIIEVFVTVDNILPTVSSLSDVTLNEGDTLMVSGFFTDPGAEPQFEGHVDYGNVADPVDDHLSLNPDNTFDLEQLYDQNGSFTVLVEIGDRSDFGVTPEDFIVTVNNVAPTLTLGSDVTINEGEMFSSGGSFSDPGVDTWTITADYGDGSTPVGIAFDDGMVFDLDHTYSDDGIFTVTVTIDDGDGGIDIESLVVTVFNVAPTVDAGPDSTIDEGDTFTSVGSFLDASGDSPTITADYGDGSSSETIIPNPDNTFDLNHVYSNDGIFTVTITADDGVDSSFDVAIVTVNNAVPSISITNQLVDENRDFTATGFFTDPGNDTWTITADYGDGSGSQSLTLNPNNSFSLAHSYSTNAAYTVTVAVNDDDASGISSFTVGVFTSTGGLAAGLTSPPDVSATLSGGATFTTANQDIWGPVTSGSGTSRWELFNPQTWNERDGDSDFITLAGKKLGGGIDAGTNGHLKLTASASQLSGEIGVNYPGTMAINYLDANTFLAGENVPVSGNWNLDTAGAKINAEKTNGDLRLDLDLGVNAFVDSEVCLLVGCFDPFIIPDISFDMHPGSTKLFSFSQAGGLDIPPALTGFAGLSGNFNPIMVQPLTTSVSTTGTIIAEKTTTFSDINIDIDKVATRLGVAPPLEKSLTASGTGLTYNLFDADANVDFKAHQKLTFDTGVLIKLDFDTPVDGVTGAVIDVTTNGAGEVTSVTYRDGQQINVIFPTGETNPITVTPTILLDPANTELHQFTELITVSDVEMESLTTSINVPGFTVIPTVSFTNPFPHLKNWECHKFLCVGGHYHHDHHHTVTTPGVEFSGIGFGVGPAWTSGPQGVETKKDTIANKAFTLGGFNTVQLVSFQLDPEVPPTAVIGGPYVVPEGSIITLDGSNSFDVDIPVQTLTYTWDLDNDVTFETGGIQVDFTNTPDGPTTNPISIQVCDEFNCDIDSGMVEVINVDPTVDVGLDDSVDEGTLYTRIGSFADPGTDEWTATVDYGDGSGIQVLLLNTDKTFDLSHTFADDNNYTVTVVVTDDDLGVGIDSFDITVNNVNPTVDAGNDQEVVIHDLVNLDPATYSDPGFDCSVCSTFEDFTAIVNWGEFSNESLTVTEISGSVGVLTEGTASGNHIYRLPGDYTVTVTVDDDNSGSTIDTLTTTVLGPRDLKERVISFLLPFDSESKNVGKAIEKINKSLDDKLWIDEVNLNPKKGHKVFDEEKDAVEKLEKLLKHDDEKDDDHNVRIELQNVAQTSIDILVNADRVLAITSMLEAQSTPVDDPKDQKKVDKENDKAQEEFDEGDAKRDEGESDKAIKHYEEAWKHSQKAIKHALGHDDDDDKKDKDD